MLTQAKDFISLFFISSFFTFSCLSYSSPVIILFCPLEDFGICPELGSFLPGIFIVLLIFLFLPLSLSSLPLLQSYCPCIDFAVSLLLIHSTLDFASAFLLLVMMMIVSSPSVVFMCREEDKVALPLTSSWSSRQRVDESARRAWKAWQEQQLVSEWLPGEATLYQEQSLFSFSFFRSLNPGSRREEKTRGEDSGSLRFWFLRVVLIFRPHVSPFFPPLIFVYKYTSASSLPQLISSLNIIIIVVKDRSWNKSQEK